MKSFVKLTEELNKAGPAAVPLATHTLLMALIKTLSHEDAITKHLAQSTLSTAYGLLDKAQALDQDPDPTYLKARLLLEGLHAYFEVE